MDPTQPPAPADPAAPSVQPPAPAAAPPAAPVAAPPAPPAPRVLNPYAVAPQRAAAPAPVTPAAPAAEVPPAPPSDPRIDGLMAALRESVDEQLASVPEGVRATVRELAGDDPIAQRRVLATLRTHGVAGPVTLPPGATTAVPAQQPAPAAVASPDADALTRWQSLKSKGAHVLAAQFRTQHAASIDRALAARNVH